MKCNKCKSLNDGVINSRPLREYTGVIRRRKCLDCGNLWTTYEYEQNDYVALKLEKHRKKVNALAKMILDLQKMYPEDKQEDEL